MALKEKKEKKDNPKKIAAKVPAPAAEPQEAAGKFSGEYFGSVGRRKSATARVRLYPDRKKRIIVNDKDYHDYFAISALIRLVNLPLKITGKEDCSVSAVVSGGGISGQAGAVTLGITRALVKMDHDFKNVLKANDLLTRDPREKERKKPGLKRARRAPQWSKR